MYLNDYITGKVFLVVPNPSQNGLGDRTAERLQATFGCSFDNITAQVGSDVARVFPLTNPQAGFLQKKLAYRTVRFSLGC
jgi:hypothetical protein